MWREAIGLRTGKGIRNQRRGEPPPIIRVLGWLLLRYSQGREGMLGPLESALGAADLNGTHVPEPREPCGSRTVFSPLCIPLGDSSGF